MKSTGVTRKIDELGRIVIPKEIRRNLGIRDGESLEIFTDSENIILKKHSQIKRYEDLGIKLTDLIKGIFDIEVIITDREKVIASSESEKIINKKLNQKFINLIDNRENYISDSNKTLEIEDTKLTGYFTIVPIIAASDSLGLIIIISNDTNNYEKLAKLMAKIMADKINIY